MEKKAKKKSCAVNKAPRGRRGNEFKTPDHEPSVGLKVSISQLQHSLCMMVSISEQEYDSKARVKS